MRIYARIMLSVLLVFVLGACAGNNETPSNDPVIDNNGENSIGNNEDPIVEDNANDEDGVNNEINEEVHENDPDGSNNENGNSDQSVITETGIYNGQADPHTIEIETAEGPTAFQLTIEARDDVEALTEGEEVTYMYTEDGDTRTISSIEMSE